MSTTMWTSTTTDSSTEFARSSGSWDDFQILLAACLSTWLVFVTIGLTAASHVESELYQQRLKWLVSKITANKTYIVFSVILNIFLLVAHEQRRDSGSISTAMEMAEVSICIVQALEMVIVWLHAVLKSREDVAMLIFGRIAIDSFVSVSVMLRMWVYSSNVSFAFAASLRLITNWRLLAAIVPSFKQLGILDQMIELICAIYFLAGLLQMCETLDGEPWMEAWLSSEHVEGSTRPQDIWTLSSSAYYVIVTATTVGYGDLTAKTVAGKIFTLILLPVGAWAVLTLISGIAHTVYLFGQAGGRYHKRRKTRPILLTGSPRHMIVWEVLSEIYHEDHYNEANQIDTIILLLPQQRHVMQEVKRLLILKGSRQMQSRVFFVSGSPLNHADLKRARCDEAMQAYVLPDVHAVDPEEEDISNCMRVLSIRQFAPHVRIVAMLLESNNRDLAKASGVEDLCLVCIDELKLQMLGKACRVMGFIPFASNLLKMAGEQIVADQEGEPPWMSYYLQGFANELYEVYLVKSYRGAPFREVVMDILSRSGGAAYLIGIIDEATHPSGTTSIHMFPGEGFRIPLGDLSRPKGVFISSELSAIHQIPENKVFRWVQHPSQMPASSQQQQPGAHPNAVPELSEGSSGDHAINFYITDPRAMAREADRVVTQAMHEAAQMRTAQGLKNGKNVSRTEIEAMFGIKVSKDAWDLGELIIEGRENITADDAEDPVTRAHLKIAKAEQQLLNSRAKAVGKIVEERRQISAVAVHIAKAKEYVARLEPSPDMVAREKELDMRALGPLPSLPQLWQSPQEPPPHVLLRGGHILFLAIERVRDPAADGGAGGPGAGKSELPHGVPQVQPLGTALKLQSFLKACRPSDEIVYRPVVVMADRVPADWSEIVRQHKRVYLLIGNGLSGQSLKYAGLLDAYCAVIHQRGPGTIDRSLADVEAIFAVRLVESLLVSHGKEVPVYCDLSLNESAIFLPGHAKKKLSADQTDRLLKDITPKMERLCFEREEQERSLPYHTRPQFVTGHLFVTNAMTCMVANLLYNPSLVKLIRELIAANYAVRSVPLELAGRQYKTVFEKILRTENMLSIAILRRMDTFVDDDEEVEDENQYCLKFQNVSEERRWTPDEPPHRRYIFVAPLGTSRVAGDDALLCLVPAHKGPTREELNIDNLVVDA